MISRNWTRIWIFSDIDSQFGYYLLCGRWTKFKFADHNFSMTIAKAVYVIVSGKMNINNAGFENENCSQVIVRRVAQKLDILECSKT